MKKLFVLLMSMFLILTLSACNNDDNPQDDSTKITADKFYGTWDSHSAKIDGSIFTIEELETMGDYSLSDFRIIIKEGGKAYAYAEGKGELLDWELSDTGIKIGVRDCTLQDNFLTITNNDITIYFSKTSNSQTIQNPETPSNTHTHSGGTATCNKKAVCSTCGQSYGSYNASNHTSSQFIYSVNSSDATKHDKKYSCCGLVVSTSEHSGGTATTTAKAKCQYCNAEYGSLVSGGTSDTTDLKSQAIAEIEEMIATLRSDYPEDFPHFSPAFVIETLQNWGYSEEIAVYAAYNCNVDWYAEARIVVNLYIVYEEEYGSPAGWMSASDISWVLEDEAFSSTVINTVISEIDWDKQIELYVLHLMEFEDNFLDGIPNRFDLIWMLQQWYIVETDEEALELINSFDIDWAPYADRVAKHIWNGSSGDEASPDQILSILDNMSLEMTSVWKFTEEETELAMSQFDDYLSAENYSQGLEYTLVDGGYAVTGIGTCTDTDVVIPKEYNGKSVVAIGVGAFGLCSSITSIAIPDSVLSISDWAFDNCSSLTKVIIGNSVTSIGSQAFSYCDALENITIPDSVASIGDSAFYICSSLTSVTIGNGVTSIGDSAFYDCYQLTSVTIGNGVTHIGNYAFLFCESLKDVTIGDSIASIGFDAFRGCYNLTDVYYTGSEEKWEKISIDPSNDDLTGATIHYNYVPKE